ncbi:unnamed protein product [Schistosoma margrebowiei]|uniref:Uncharacterized protein n=1 Tax=Schistosoma margrebowiei TaxID=48269 RepID=A0A183MQ89_9TREM|nr:unnamed protein product [Schistosoma margrebowiei]
MWRYAFECIKVITCACLNDVFSLHFVWPLPSVVSFLIRSLGRQLLRVGKPRTQSVNISVKVNDISPLPSTSTVTSHQQLPCDGSITSDYTNQMSAPFDVYHSHELAKTLPAHISDPNVDLCKTPARQSNTLPVKCIHDSKTTGNFDILFNSSPVFSCFS